MDVRKRWADHVVGHRASRRRSHEVGLPGYTIVHERPLRAITWRKGVRRFSRLMSMAPPALTIPRPIRWVIWRLLLFFSSVGLVVFIVGILICLHIAWCRLTKSDVLPLIRESRVAQRLFLDPSFTTFVTLLADHGLDPGGFEAVWDYDARVRLSKHLFVPTEMFGQMKYAYRPNLGVYNVVVWSGLERVPLILAANPDLSDALSRCAVVHQAYFETDANGLKKTAFPPNGTPPIFFLGDSFTEGLWTASEDTFVSRFGNRLRDEGLEAVPMNLGVNGYSALEMSWMVERSAPVFHPKLVVLNVFPNDVTNHYEALITNQIEAEEGFQEFFQYVARIAEYCRTHRIALVVSMIPVQEQFQDLDRYWGFQQRVSAWGQEHGIPVLDPRERFRQAGLERVYLPWDPHFSAQGHHIYADFLYDSLRPLIHRLYRPPAAPSSG